MNNHRIRKMYLHALTYSHIHRDIPGDEKITKISLPKINTLYQDSSIRKAKSIIKDNNHPLSNEYKVWPKAPCICMIQHQYESLH